MLEKFNEFYSKLITENIEDTWIRTITKDNDFYKVYLKPLMKKYNVDIVKARLNTFRIGGLYENVIEALKNFTVNEQYWDNSAMR
jgi:hypothetical protein